MSNADSYKAAKVKYLAAKAALLIADAAYRAASREHDEAAAKVLAEVEASVS